MAGPVRLLSDDALVRAARSGSDDAFAEIVRRHGPRVQRQCRRVVGPDRADDALQQTLTGALLALRRPEDGRAIDLERWLARIARNASIDVLRRSMPDWAELDERIDGVRRPPQVAADRERLRRTVADIQDLPERQRRAIVLHAFEGRSWEEIARELDVGEPAVRQLLHRARTRLRDVAGVLIGPFWLLRPAGARAASLLAGAAGGGGAKAAAGLTAALVLAGGTVVATSPSHHPRVSAALAVADAAASAPAPADPTAGVTVDDGGPSSLARVTRHAGHHRGRREPRAAARRRARRTGAPAPPGAAPAHGRSRHHGTGTPADPPSAPKAAAPSAPNTAGAPAPTAAPPAPPVSAPAPDPPAPSAPPAPAGPPAPAAIGHIVQWTPGPGVGGMLRIEGLPTGSETAPVGELTTITCVHAEAGIVLTSGPCTPAQIAIGGLVSVADRAFNANAGTVVWTTLQLLR